MCGNNFSSSFNLVHFFLFCFSGRIKLLLEPDGKYSFNSFITVHLYKYIDLYIFKAQFLMITDPGSSGHSSISAHVTLTLAPVLVTVTGSSCCLPCVRVTHYYTSNMCKITLKKPLLSNQYSISSIDFHVAFFC